MLRPRLRLRICATVAAVEAGEETKELFTELALAPQLEEFLTLRAYTRLE